VGAFNGARTALALAFWMLVFNTIPLLFAFLVLKMNRTQRVMLRHQEVALTT
jgi:hypothetical protein